MTSTRTKQAARRIMAHYDVKYTEALRLCQFAWILHDELDLPPDVGVALLMHEGIRSPKQLAAYLIANGVDWAPHDGSPM
ncbi:hypothetical protein [Nocardioides jiangxiensis]|uniref:Uncharacterized protein n=1 Tax=Nocardioides jiangxiensis TaxID=3064524 RepID=A0ABT9B1G1_9ACTN|nr:hypothetical protein [Nocardioides sp. WY-20]MDO7868154.1 hypothetical protein [Nocardioides sp. WY-20]